jgi:hypothetical protein
MDPKEIPDRDLIHEGVAKNPYPFWLWLSVVAILIALAWGLNSWYYTTIASRINSNPFLQVTNRELSLFLWNNPHLMRVNVSKKTGYLPAFQYLDSVTVEPELADQFVVAPPELLFLYHTWRRQVSHEYPLRPISVGEFREFLDYAEEWQPRYWPDAPKGYISFIQSLPQIEESNLQNLTLTTLPKNVRMAFQGWKNFFKEGKEINSLKVTYAEIAGFLKKYPHYARNYWMNVIDHSYLKSIASANSKSDYFFPVEELAPFLKAALYNEQKLSIPK